MSHLRSRNVPVVTVSRGLALPTLLILLSGVLVLVMQQSAAMMGWVSSPLYPGLPWAAAFGWVLLLAVGRGVTILAHELGHVLAYNMLGAGWRELSLGSVVSVRSHRSFTHREQILVSFMGPAMEIMLGTMLAVSATPWSLACILGCFAAANGALNLLPLHPRVDGFKMWSGLLHTLRGRGSSKPC